MNCKIHLQNRERFVIYCRSILFCSVYLHDIALSECTDRSKGLGKERLDQKSKTSPQIWFTSVKRASSITTLVIRENQKTLFDWDLAVHDKRSCCNENENMGHTEQAVSLSWREQRMLKEIHIHLGAGGSWETKTPPAPHATVPKTPQPQNFLVIPNHSEWWFVFHHNVYVLKTPPWCHHFLFTHMDSKEQRLEETGDAPCPG